MTSVLLIAALVGNIFFYSEYNFGIDNLDNLDVKAVNLDDVGAGILDNLEVDVTKTWNAIWENVHTANPKNKTLAALDDNFQPLDVNEVFDIFPAPNRSDSIQIYDRKAYHDLIQMFITKRDGIKICASGGSSTAGGGHIQLIDRYFGNFGHYVRKLQINASGPITLIDRGHGTRSSLHTAVFAPNFLPHETDLLFWEFAINDYGYNLPEEFRVQQERSVFIAWLREVEKMSPRPPKVILIYLWRSPFGLNFKETHLINNPVYESHAQLAKEFDFVVGHVNLASYFDELSDMLGLDDLKRLFLADAHHTNRLGHLAESFLLLNLLRGEGEWSKGKSDEVVTGQPRQNWLEKYDWSCGNETEDKKFLQSRIVESDDTDSGWRSPLGTMTLEKPRNEIVVSGSKQLVVRSNFENITSLGKQDPARADRQGSISLACCMDNSNSKYTVVTIPENTDPMQNARAIFFGLGREKSKISNLKVYIDEENDAAGGKLIKVPHHWPCFWTFRDMYDTAWFAFNEKQTEISAVRLCVENYRCKVSGMSDVMMISMAVYA
jgi:hypothetical protein